MTFRARDGAFPAARRTDLAIFLARAFIAEARFTGFLDIFFIDGLDFFVDFLAVFFAVFLAGLAYFFFAIFLAMSRLLAWAADVI